MRGVAGLMLQTYCMVELQTFCRVNAANILQGRGCKHFKMREVEGLMLQTFYRLGAANVLQGRGCKHFKMEEGLCFKHFASLERQTFSRREAANILKWGK